MALETIIVRGFYRLPAGQCGIVRGCVLAPGATVTSATAVLIVGTKSEIESEAGKRGLPMPTDPVASAPQDALQDRKALLALTDSELGKRVREAWTAPVDEPVDVTRRGE